MNPSHLRLYAAAAGIVSHWAYFIHGEHHLAAPTLARLALLLPALLFVTVYYYMLSLYYSLSLTIQTTTAFYASLWTSIFIYRAFFHPLHHFPGPFMWKVSKLWHVYKLLPKSNNYLQLHSLHQKYGDFVRTGPNEISIANPEAIPVIFGPGSKCVKAPWYDAAPPISLQTIRDRRVHDKRRKVWDQGFGARGMKAFVLDYYVLF